MGDLFDALQRLQAVEQKLGDLRRTAEGKQRRIDLHHRQIKKIDEELDENRTATQDQQIRSDALSLDVAAREESIARHRDALSKAKTNKEYAAILTAINTEKADNAKLENEVLEMMERIGTLKTAASEVDAEKTQLLERVASGEADLKKYLADTKQERSQHQAERDLCARDIPASTMATFNRVAEHHDGEAMVPVTRIHPKRHEYTCSGCNLQVTREVVSALHTRIEVQFCHVCGRILYLEETAAKSR